MKWVENIIENRVRIINWVGVVLGSWILSMIASEVIAMAMPAPNFQASVTPDASALTQFTDRGKTFAYYLPICERNIFDSEKRSSCVQTQTNQPTLIDEPEPQDPNASPVKSNINAKLKGTTVFGDPNRSFATISESGKSETENYKIDDKILDKARIYKIERNRVFFFNNGRREYLEIEGPSIYAGSAPSRSPAANTAGGIKRDGNNITVSRSMVDKTMANMNQVLQDARMVPNFNNGVVDGFKIFGIKSGSIFQQVGLRNGDVINQINGTTVDGLEKALPMLQLLKTQDDFDIGITRRGRKQNLNIKVQ